MGPCLGHWWLTYQETKVHVKLVLCPSLWGPGAAQRPQSNVVTFSNLRGNLFYTSEMGFRQWDLVSAACMWEFSTTSSDPVCQVSWFVMTLECGFLRSLLKLL